MGCVFPSFISLLWGAELPDEEIFAPFCTDKWCAPGGKLLCFSQGRLAAARPAQRSVVFGTPRINISRILVYPIRSYLSSTFLYNTSNMIGLFSSIRSNSILIRWWSLNTPNPTPNHTQPLKSHRHQGLFHENQGDTQYNNGHTHTSEWHSGPAGQADPAGLGLNIQKVEMSFTESHTQYFQ